MYENSFKNEKRILFKSFYYATEVAYFERSLLSDSDIIRSDVLFPVGNGDGDGMVISILSVN